MPRWVVVTLVLALLALVIVAAWQGFQRWRAKGYEAQVPAEVQLDGLVQASIEQGLMQGCGAVVFKLADTTVQALQREGVSALRQARQARGEPSPHYSYGPWRETPYAETGDGMSQADRWLLGLNCASLSSELDAAIQAALVSKGAYYAKTVEGGLILIPARGLAVLSFDG